MKIIETLLRKRRNNESYFKYIMGLLHLWVGLVVGVFICIVSISGAIFSLHEEFDNFENHSLSHLDEAVTQQVSIDTLVANFQAEYKTKPWRIIVPADSSENISITLRPIGFDRRMFFFHRETGELIGEATNYSEGIAVTMVQLHRWLMLPNQKLGTQLVGINAVLFLFLLLTGVVLWFPTSRKKLKLSFSLSLAGPFRKKNWALHINYGFYSVLFLLIITFSGLCITYPSVRVATLNLFKEENPEKKEKSKRPIKKEDYDYYKSIAPEQTYDRMFAVANLKMSYNSDMRLFFPPPHLPEYTIFRTNPENFMGGKWSDMSTFNNKGKYKRTYYFEDMKPEQKLNNLISSIHKGEIFGTPSRILYLLLALFACYLPISGFIIWWKRSKKKILG